MTRRPAGRDPRIWLPLLALFGCSPPPEESPSCETDAFRTWYPDADGDGHGDPAGKFVGCRPSGPGYVLVGDDCDDANDQVTPGGGENCATDGDDNCDGNTNSDPDINAYECVDYYLDNDQDGYGQVEKSRCYCQPEGAWSARQTGDCDDHDPAVWVGSPGCRVVAEQDWLARYNGFQENQGLGYNQLATGFLTTDLDQDGVLDLLVGSAFYASELEDLAGALFVVSGPLSGELRLDDPSVYKLEGSSDTETTLLASSLMVADLDVDGKQEVVVRGHGDVPGIWILDGGRIVSEGMGAASTRIEAQTAPSSRFGVNGAVSSDLDGDGLVELILGDRGDDETAELAGAVYVLENPPAGYFDVSEVYAAKLLGQGAFDGAGNCVADAGDTDGDGLGEIIVASDEAGATWLVRGPLEGAVSLSDADAKFWQDEPSGLFGCALAGGGDANGDGLNDLLVGVPWQDREQGGAYLVLGTPALQGRMILADVAEATFVGTGGSFTGESLAFLNAEDHSDTIAIGSPSADFAETGAGALTCVVGPTSGVHIVGSVGSTLNGEGLGVSLGTSLSPAGDLDGDGWEELLTGSSDSNPDDIPHAGSIYLLSGARLAGY